MVVCGLHFADLLDGDFYLGLVSVPFRVQDLGRLVLGQPVGGEHHSAIENHLRQGVLVRVQHRFPHPRVLDGRLHVNSVLEKSPVRFGDDFKVVGGHVHLCPPFATLALQIGRSSPGEEFVGSIPSSPGGATSHRWRRSISIGGALAIDAVGRP